MTPDPGHFDTLVGLLYLDGELPSERALEVAAHAEHCRACSRLLSQLERESRWLTQTLQAPEPAPAAPASAWARVGNRFAPGWLWLIGVAAAASAAAVALGPLERWLANGISFNDVLSLAFFNGLFWPRWARLFSDFQSVAIIAIGALGLALLRGRGRRSWRVSAGALLLPVLLANPGPVQAARVFRGSDFVLPAGQTLHDDLFVEANSVRIDGTIDGDLVAFSRSVTVNGVVTGNVFTFSKYLNLPGTVNGDIASFSDYVTVSGEVSRSLYGFIHHLRVGAAGQLGAATLACESLDLEGAVRRDLILSTNWGTISGRIGGDVKAIGNHLQVAPGARIGGRLSVRGAQPPEISPGAAIAGGWQYLSPRQQAAWRTWSFYWNQVLHWAAAFVLGWLLLALVPGYLRRCIGGLGPSASAVGATLGLGIVVLAATPILAILAAFTLIGIPITVILAMAYAVAIYVAGIVVGLWLGRGLLGELPVNASSWPMLGLGLAIERVALNLPFNIGLVICGLILVVGLGAQARALYLGWHRGRAASLPAPVHV